MMSTEEKVAHAYEEHALPDLFMGKWPYHEPEAYMAPSNVPTNWRRLLEALSLKAATTDGLCRDVNDSLVAMTNTPEGFYCAAETILTYLRHRAQFSCAFVIDYQDVANAMRLRAHTVEADARTLHLDWMGPTTETLWERLERRADTLLQEHGVHIL
jgi:hypothetical protein